MLHALVCLVTTTFWIRALDYISLITWSAFSCQQVENDNSSFSWNSHFFVVGSEGGRGDGQHNLLRVHPRDGWAGAGLPALAVVQLCAHDQVVRMLYKFYVFKGWVHQFSLRIIKILLDDKISSRPRSRACGQTLTNDEKGRDNWDQNDLCRSFWSFWFPLVDNWWQLETSPFKRKMSF